MAVTRETGVLLVADLTGYTAYLAGSEIEHAPTIAGDLLETVVGRLEPPFRLAKLEGDAAFLFVEDGRADPPLLLDAIDACYLAFRRRLRSIDAATSCDCSACRLAPRLDLKFFAHHGAFVRTRIAGHDELAGPDVILVHRLLKGTSASTLFPSGFVLLTDAAADALGLDPAAIGMTRAVEPVEHLGEVVTWAADLDARWQAETATRRLDPMAEPVLLAADLDVRAAPADAWAALTSPALRAGWEGAIEIDDSGDARISRGVGTTTRCVTGRLATIEEVVDWRPFDYVGWRVAVAGLGPVAATADFDARPDGSGTRIRLRWCALGDSVDAAVSAEFVDAKRSAVARLERTLDRGARPVLEPLPGPVTLA
jgi:hypothetical protein